MVRNDEGQPWFIHGVAFDISELKRAEAAGQEYAERLKFLSRRLMEVQETERRNIALELHDEIGQVLTGLKLTLEMGARLPAEEVGNGLDRGSCAGKRTDGAGAQVVAGSAAGDAR